MALIFHGIIFYLNLDGVGEKLAEVVADTIGTLSGVVSQHLNEGVHYAILRHVQQPEYAVARDAGIPVLSPEWVIECGTKQTLLPVPEVHTLFLGPEIPGFTEHVQEVSQSEFKGSDRHIIAYRVECTGATYSGRYDARTITHLLAPDLQVLSQKIETALSNGIPVVTSAYIDACLSAWKYLSEEPYRRQDVLVYESDNTANAADEVRSPQEVAAPAHMEQQAVAVAVTAAPRAEGAVAAAAEVSADTMAVRRARAAAAELHEQVHPGATTPHHQEQPVRAQLETLCGRNVLQERPAQQAEAVPNAASGNCSGDKAPASATQADDSQQGRPNLDALITGLTAHLDASQASPDEQQPRTAAAAARQRGAAPAAAMATTSAPSRFRPAMGACAGSAAAQLAAGVPRVAGLSKRRGRASGSGVHPPAAAVPVPGNNSGSPCVVRQLPTPMRIRPEPEQAIGAQQPPPIVTSRRADPPPAKQQQQQQHKHKRHKRQQQQAAAAVPGLDLTELDPTTALKALVPKVTAPGHAAFTGPLAALPAAASRGGRGRRAMPAKAATAGMATVAEQAAAGCAAPAEQCNDDGNGISPPRRQQQQQEDGGGCARRRKLAVAVDVAGQGDKQLDEDMLSPELGVPAAVVAEAEQHKACTSAKSGRSRSRKKGAKAASAPAPMLLQSPGANVAATIATAEEVAGQAAEQQSSSEDDEPLKRPPRSAAGKRVGHADARTATAQAKRHRGARDVCAAKRSKEQQEQLREVEQEEEEEQQQQQQEDNQEEGSQNEQDEEDEQLQDAAVATAGAAPLQQPARVALSGMHTRERNHSAALLARLHISCLKSKHQWQAATTHIVMPDLRRYEKSVCGLAAGVWLLRTTFLDACKAAGRLLADPMLYELHDGVNGSIADGAPAHWRARREATDAGAYAGLQVILYGAMPDSPGPSQAVLKRIVAAGGGKVVAIAPPFKLAVLHSKGAKLALVGDEKTKADKHVKQLLAAGIPCCNPMYLMEFVAQPWTPLKAHYKFGTSASPELKALEEERARDPRPPEQSMSF